MTPEEEEPVPLELQEFTQENPTNLFLLMKKKVQEDKEREEQERLKKMEELEQLKKKKMIRFLKEDAKSHLDTLFEDLYTHVKNFA